MNKHGLALICTMLVAACLALAGTANAAVVNDTCIVGTVNGGSIGVGTCQGVGGINMSQYSFTTRLMCSGCAPEYATRGAGFRGWGTAAGGCRGGVLLANDPCRTQTTTTAWSYRAGHWQRASIHNGTWIWVQPYAGSWMWAYSAGTWYAVQGYDINAYCHGAPNRYSNCIAAIGAPM